jgi:thiamine-phosphate pyrophosphorylase
MSFATDCSRLRGGIHGLYAVTAQRDSSAALIAEVDAALRGGARLVQWREKRQAHAQNREVARQLRRLTRERGALFIVNDDTRRAIECEADGVHWGRDEGNLEDLFAAARGAARHGKRLITGVSCYDDLQRALRAESLGADYVAFGSFFPSATKPDARRAPLELLARARRALSIPIVAIGGIDLENAVSVIEAGADAIAVVGGLFGARDVEETARRFCALPWPSWGVETSLR